MNQTIKDRIAKINNGQVPEGYEKTSFGIFPCDWEKDKSLGDICEINPKTEALPNEFIYIDLESVVDGKLIQENVIEKAKAPSRAQRVLQKNDVIYQMVRPYQKNNFIFIQDDGNYKYVASTGYAQLRSDNYGFLYQMVNSEYFCTQVLKKCTGTNYPAINSQDLAEVNCAYPKSEQEQSRIAQILMQWDKTIELQEKYIASLENRKKALMQRLLTPKEGWKKLNINMVLKEVVIKSTINNQYPVVSSTTKGLFLQTEYFDKMVASKDNVGYKILKQGQVVLSPQNLWMGNINYNRGIEIGIVSPSYKVFSIKDKYDKEIIAQILKSDEMLETYKNLSEQGASVVRRNLDMDSFYKANIYYPNEKEVKIISNVIIDSDRELRLQNQKLNKFKEQRKALQQYLLTGIVRVV